MKMSMVRMARLILVGLCLLAMGCSVRQPMENANVKPKQDLKDLEAKVAMTLPSDAVLLHSTDGGGRDPSCGFYAWTVFSPSSIKMPPMRATGVREYLDFSTPADLADMVKLVEAKMQRRKICHPQAAFGSEWENDAYTFRGTLVRSSEGDYLVIERFKKK